MATSPAALVALGALAFQILLLFVYLLVTETPVTDTMRLLLPFVWTTLAIWLLAHFARNADAPGVERFDSRRWMAGAIATGYLLVLASLGGLVGLTSGGTAVHVVPATPGWGPVVVATIAPVHLILVPYEVVGYLALSYGIYRAILATTRGALAGVVGLFSCVGCTLPLVGALVSVAGGATIATLPDGSTLQLSTVVFVSTVLLLAWAVPTKSSVPT